MLGVGDHQVKAGPPRAGHRNMSRLAVKVSREVDHYMLSFAPHPFSYGILMQSSRIYKTLIWICYYAHQEELPRILPAIHCIFSETSAC